MSSTSFHTTLSNATSQWPRAVPVDRRASPATFAAAVVAPVPTTNAVRRPPLAQANNVGGGSLNAFGITDDRSDGDSHKEFVVRGGGGGGIVHAPAPVMTTAGRPLLTRLSTASSLSGKSSGSFNLAATFLAEEDTQAEQTASLLRTLNLTPPEEVVSPSFAETNHVYVPILPDAYNLSNIPQVSNAHRNTFSSTFDPFASPILTRSSGSSGSSDKEQDRTMKPSQTRPWVTDSSPGSTPFFSRAPGSRILPHAPPRLLNSFRTPALSNSPADTFPSPASNQSPFSQRFSDTAAYSPAQFYGSLDQYSPKMSQSHFDGWVTSKPERSTAHVVDDPRLTAILQGERGLSHTQLRGFDSSPHDQEAFGLSRQSSIESSLFNLGSRSSSIPSISSGLSGYSQGQRRGPMMDPQGLQVPMDSPVPQWVPLGPFPRRSIEDWDGRNPAINNLPFNHNSSFARQQAPPRMEDDEPLNFLQLLNPNARPPYQLLVTRICKKSDQQASIFIQQKLKNGTDEERAYIVSCMAERGVEMMQGRFGNWCIQRALESPCTREDRLKVVDCMIGRVVELACNVYGTHVIQKALDCEEDIRRAIVKELLEDDPASTLVNKHCSHVWAKVLELEWTEPAPAIFPVINSSLQGQWTSLACHETGSLVVQTLFENIADEEAKSHIVNEILDNLEEVVKSQWGAFVASHIIEHGSDEARERTLDLLIEKLGVYAVHDVGVKSVIKIIKPNDTVVMSKIIDKMVEPNTSGSRRRALLVDLALTTPGAQLIGQVLPHADKEQRGKLYDAIRSHVVTLRGCKTGSRVIWLFDRMRAYYGY